MGIVKIYRTTGDTYRLLGGWCLFYFYGRPAKGAHRLVKKDEWLRAEGDCFPGRTYAEVVLEPDYEQAKAELLAPMLEVNKAHLLIAC
ncbi:hypothetical protein QJ48_06830 [Paenibacillus sp. A3]|uniref:hypothetical protein n=1 Tax=Paenibacillus sp. A3 TaxID=1337054 RepID=UPI0006D5462F|nr:hypothetical protein [Paenibacillus sp. A3]KPV60220.1 hypothetical protein QJ48_06830 [Paenibacillus sp. A3]